MSWPTLILLLVVLVAAGYFVVKWLFQKDTEIENRRRGAARLAGVLSSKGLVKVPEFLIDYSVGDYSGMGNNIKKLAALFLDGEEAVVKEFDKVFENLLDAKLSVATGRAYIAAKLEDASNNSDPSVVTRAPMVDVK